MKIRKTIAASIIAMTALVGTATTAEAFNPQPEPPANQQDDDQRPSNPFDRPVDPARSRGIAEIEFVEVAGSDNEPVHAGSRKPYIKIKLSK